jgi:hypothetical protein
MPKRLHLGPHDRARSRKFRNAEVCGVSNPPSFEAFEEGGGRALFSAAGGGQSSGSSGHLLPEGEGPSLKPIT